MVRMAVTNASHSSQQWGCSRQFDKPRPLSNTKWQHQGDRLRPVVSPSPRHTLWPQTAGGGIHQSPQRTQTKTWAPRKWLPPQAPIQVHRKGRDWVHPVQTHNRGFAGRRGTPHQDQQEDHGGWLGEGRGGRNKTPTHHPKTAYAHSVSYHALDDHSSTTPIWKSCSHQRHLGWMVRVVLWTRHSRSPPSTRWQDTPVRRTKRLEAHPRPGPRWLNPHRGPHQCTTRPPLLATARGSTHPEREKENPLTDQSNISGTSHKRATWKGSLKEGRKEANPREKESRKIHGHSTGHSRTPRKSRIAGTTMSTTLVRDPVADRTIVQSAMGDGCAMPPLHTMHCPHIPKWQLGGTAQTDAPATGQAGTKTAKPDQGNQSPEPFFPWMNHVPQRLLQRLTWKPQQTTPTDQHYILLLYAGKDDAGSLDSCIHSLFPEVSHMLWAIDTRRDPGPTGQDMLREEPYNTLCTLATQGRIIFVGGGPNCRTSSILRWFPKPNAPTPVRGRAEDTLWGLPGLSQQELQDTDDDSTLMLRQMYLTSLVYSTNKDLPTPRVTGSFLQHPRDPSECSNNPQAHKCSSIWVSQAYIRWANQLRHHRIKFDQCELGQVVTKATTLWTDLPLHHWQDMQCTHGTHRTSDDIRSSDLSRYPWAMMEGLASAMILHLQKTLQSLAKPVGPTPAPTTPTRKRGLTPRLPRHHRKQPGPTKPWQH